MRYQTPASKIGKPAVRLPVLSNHLPREGGDVRLLGSRRSRGLL